MPSCPSVKVNLERCHFILLRDASVVMYFVNVREPSATVCQNATSIRASSTTWCQDVALARAHGAVTKIDSSAAMLQLVDSPHRFIRLLLFMLVVMLYSGHPPLGLRSIQMKGQMEGPQRRRRDISSANSIFNTRLQMNQRSFCQMIAPTFNQNPAPSRKSKISSGKIRQQVQRTFSFSFNF